KFSTPRVRARAISYDEKTVTGGRTLVSDVERGLAVGFPGAQSVLRWERHRTHRRRLWISSFGDSISPLAARDVGVSRHGESGVSQPVPGDGRCALFCRSEP